jgi:hypothetical protein
MQLIKLDYNQAKNNKLAKNGVRYTDALFNKIEKQCMDIYKQCGSYQEFIQQSTLYTSENPLILAGYDVYMKDLVKKAISNVSFSRQAQKTLTEIAITNSVGDLVKTNGEDLKQDIRAKTLKAYQQGINPQEYYKTLSAPPLIKGIDDAKRTLGSRDRCRMIARTETKRALNVSNYIIGKDRGATHWYALGFTDDKTCEECIDTYGTPEDGYVYYSIDNTENLPPLHPNCRHTAVFTINVPKDATVID